MSILAVKPMYKLNHETGLIEAYDPISGVLLGVQQSRDDILTLAPRIADRMRLIKLEDGREIWLEHGINPDRIPTNFKWKYSDIYAAMICEQITLGKTLTQICNMQGYPSYSAVCRWRREVPQFKEMLDDAKRDRAEQKVDEALQIVDELKMPTSEEIQHAKLRADMRKWYAEKDDAAKFGSKLKVQADVVSTTLVVHTGILRPGDPGYKEVTPNGTNKEFNENSSYIDSPPGGGVACEFVGVEPGGCGVQHQSESSDDGAPSTPGQY